MKNSPELVNRTRFAIEIIRLATISQIVFLILMICAFLFIGLTYLETFFALIFPAMILLSLFSFFACALVVGIAESKPMTIGASVIALIPIVSLAGLIIANLQATKNMESKSDGEKVDSTTLRVMMFGTWGFIFVLTVSLFLSFSNDSRRLRLAANALFGEDDSQSGKFETVLSSSEKDEIATEFQKVAAALKDFDQGNSELTRAEVNDYLVWMESILDETPDTINTDLKRNFESLNARRSELMAKAKVVGAAAKTAKASRGKNAKKGNAKNSKKSENKKSRRPRPKKTTEILIATEIDESGKLVISQGNIRWLGDKATWPARNKINHKDWNPQSEVKFANSIHKYFAGRADFETAAVEVVKGRGDVRLIRNKIGVTLQIIDAEEGKSPYLVKVSMSKIAAPPKAKKDSPK